MGPEALTAVMLGGLLLLIVCGAPIAFAIGAIGLATGYVVYDNSIVALLYNRAMGLMVNYILLAVPLFVFMGTILEYSGIAEKMYDALYLWLGGLRGGLALTTILLGTIMAATVGIIAASVTMLALVGLPAMLKRGYSKSLATGTICAGGCLGILIPPSIMLVVYGPMAQISVGRLFFAAFVPGFLLSGLYIVYILVYSYLNPQAAPPVPKAELAGISFARKTKEVVIALVPVGVLVLAVLGVIFLGIAPPTEAAAVGAFAATLLTIAYRKFNWKVLKEVSMLTMKTSGFIFAIAAMAFVFVGVFVGGGGGKVMEAFILGAPGGQWGAFFIVMFIVFILGFFIDWLAIVFILVPIITPIAARLGFDEIWFAMMVIINFQTSFMTPPFAMAIFILKGLAKPETGITMTDIIRGVIPFVILVLVGLALCIAFPELITWLPNKMIKPMG